MQGCASSPHEFYMAQALRLAETALGRTAPNPAVGAVIVKDGQVVGRGFHPKAGEPHAEVFALRQAGDQAQGATAYVTLEPCSHQGRTGPCCDALIAAGVSQVYVGTIDPNPKVSGQGIARMEAAGIEVTIGVLEKECRRLIAPFVMHILAGRPWFILKSATTLDGKTATSTGHSQWITNEHSRAHVHQLRNRVDAIMVGIGTVLRDNPRLTTRIEGPCQDPVRVVVDSRLRIPLDCHLVRHQSHAPTLIVTGTNVDTAKIEQLRRLPAVEVVTLPLDGGGRVDLNALASYLGRRDILSVLVEGGAELNSSLLDSGLVDQIMLYVAPKLVGGADGKGMFAGQGVTDLSQALQLKDLRIRHFGDDLLIEGEVDRCSPA